MTNETVAVAVVGAGPYGLSVSAHLSAHGIEHRVFGTTMQAWSDAMPRGMFLKSRPPASNLSAPNSASQLDAFCDEHEMPRFEPDQVLPLSTFLAYGHWFQRKWVPHVESQRVRHIVQEGRWFRLRLETEECRAERVVLAVGIRDFPRIPAHLSRLPISVRSHTADHNDLSRFAGMDVVVAGAGQSALESAALLHESGATVRVVARRPALDWDTQPGSTAPTNRWRTPSSGLGGGWHLLAYSRLPRMYRWLPPETRVQRARTTLGPSGAWWLRDRVEGQLPILTGRIISDAEVTDGGLGLRLLNGDGEEETVRTQHLLLATGYRFNVGALNLLDADLRAAVRSYGGFPILSRSFESAVPGLHFVGHAAQGSFGPISRFVYGADFTARTLLARLRGARPTSPTVHIPVFPVPRQGSQPQGFGQKTGDRRHFVGNAGSPGKGDKGCSCSTIRTPWRCS